ncbi:hypothetical protein BGW36DRAFT_463516 [Talaromyces proteolyticus]|uniref:Uncharacterized protein n=1 Tax=Talaromyces proteolyticus TaxID=1131652 RepID=A0AAD4KQI7_9EURO|nr:uncharacterized protein BGW36DRAFT_463516 [Talaromyces proteolyticus]KAH8693884.1 hypothetical protein BGW36DRAFT_463516 [Talaromyces proteolyticus]
MGRGQGGPLGLVGMAVGFGMEVYQHRKETKSKRQNVASQNSSEDIQNSLPSTHLQSARSLGENSSASNFAPNDAPPSYQEVVNTGSSQSYYNDKAVSDSYPREKDSSGDSRFTNRTIESLDTHRHVDSSPYDDENGNRFSNRVHQGPKYDTGDSHADLEDEKQWELDEAAEEFGPHDTRAAGESDGPAQTEEEKIKQREAFINELVYIVGPPPRSVEPLACPIIIPQRRPGKRDRGFVRAYAPVLNNSGISQDAFLKFLKDWQTASRASPWWDVVIVSSAIAGFAPGITAMVVTTVAQIAASAAKEVQSRSRHNTYLDRVNQEVFMPRGLVAVVMKFKPDSQLVQGGSQSQGLLGNIGGIFGSMVSSERLDLSQAAVKVSQTGQIPATKIQKFRQNMHVASGVTRGEIELPDAAELVFPNLDYVASQPSVGAKAKLKSANKFVQDYLDRRAQAKYAADNPGSALTSYVPKFASKLSDPTAGMAQGGLRGSPRRGDRRGRNSRGGLIGLATQLIANTQDNQRSESRYEDDYNTRARYGGRPLQGGESANSAQYGTNQGRQKGGRGLKKLMQQDVLYLIIVNLPTEQEVRSNMRELEMAMEDAVNRGA